MSRTRSKPNKTEQIARFMLGKGAMSSREVFEAGFKFNDGVETTVSGISVLLNKMHHSSRYTVERHLRGYGGGTITMVKVLEIKGAKSGDQGEAGELSTTKGTMWRQLLTRKNGVALNLGVA